MTNRTAELALKTLEVLDERGWSTGSLIDDDWVYASAYDVPFNERHSEFFDEDGNLRPEKAAECKVCVLGAAGEAFYGDPRRGYSTAKYADPEYVAFVETLANKVDPYHRLVDRDAAVYGFNDSAGEDAVRQLLADVAAGAQAAEAVA